VGVHSLAGVLRFLLALVLVSSSASAVELAGRVVDVVGGGIDHVRIDVLDRETGEPVSGLPFRTDSEGRFGPVQVEPGVYRLVLTHLKRRSEFRYMKSIVDVEAPTDDARIVLKAVRRYRIEGQVVPLAGVAESGQYRLRAEPVHVLPDGGPDDVPREAWIHPKGVFLLVGLPAGLYRMQLVDPHTGTEFEAVAELGELRIDQDLKGVLLEPR